jgi:hypothetical protein
MTRTDPPAHSGTQKKQGTADGPVLGHEVTAEELAPTRGFPAGVAIAIVALILVGTLVFALLFASDAPDLSPDRGTTVIIEDGDISNAPVTLD